MTDAHTNDITNLLAKLLATSYTLYLKTHNYHWNVSGPMFSSLHTLFEQQYTELALAVDEIAERIKALGARAPGSYSEFSKLSVINEDSDSPTAKTMIANLADDMEALVELAKEIITLAEKNSDSVSADMAIRRIEIHQKNIWMLRSHLE